MSQGPTDDEHVGALTGAYALDALDPVERARVERHLERCAACAAEVRSFRETTARLAGGTAVTPPPGLRERVLAEAAGTRQLPPRVPAEHPGRRAVPPPVRWLSLAAAVLLALTVAGGTLAWQAREDAEAARTFAAAVTDALTDPDREVVTADFGSGRGTVIVAEGEVVLVGDDVEVPGDDQVFQLWFIGPEGPRPADLLEAVDDDTVWTAAQGWRPGDVVAVTVEPAGGSEQPTSQPVLVAEPGAG